MTARSDRSVPGDPQLHAGAVVAERYQILDLVGDGGMGRVYRARQLGLGRDVALKTLRPDLDSDVALTFYRERFEAEAALAASLTHPNSVRIFDFGINDGSFYLVMELLEGRPLDHLMAEGPRTAGGTLMIARRLCGALAEAHRLGIVHRDVKPANVMLCPTPESPTFVKLMDFGLAAPVRQGSPTDLDADDIDPDADIDPGSTIDFVEGTPHYAAPEQIRSASVDGRADVYGVGAFMLALLTGSHPFEEASERDVLRQQLESDPPALESALAGDEPRIPVEVAQLIADCMQRNPDDRIPDMPTLARRIDACETSLGDLGSPLDTLPADVSRTLPVVGELVASRTLVPGGPLADADAPLRRPEPVSLTVLGAILALVTLAFALGMWLDAAGS